MEICDTLDYGTPSFFLGKAKRARARQNSLPRGDARAEEARDIWDQYLSQYFNHFRSSLALPIPNKNKGLPVV